MAGELSKFLGADAPAAETSSAGSLSRFLEGQPKTSALESGARGLLQELTLGHADEIAGGLESLFTSKTYKQARDESRANYAKAEGDNPLAYGAGQLAGGVASLAIPGGALLKAGKGLRGAAALGGVYGAGKSEAEDIAGVAKDAALGAGAGAAFYGGVRLAGAGLGKLRDVAAKGGPVVDFATKRLSGAAGAAVAEALGGGGLMGYVAGEALAKLAPKAGGAVRKLLAKGEVDAARAAAKASPGWEKQAAAALERAELAPAAPRAARPPAELPSGAAPTTPAARWDQAASSTLAAPELAPAAPRTSLAPPPAPIAEPPPRPTPLIGRDPKTGRWVSAKKAEKKGLPLQEAGKSAAPADAAPAPVSGAPEPPARKTLNIVVEPPTAPAPPPAAADDLGAQLKTSIAQLRDKGDAGTVADLKAIIAKNNATKVVPREDQSTVDALTNIVSSQSRAPYTPGIRHYPAEPHVAFKEYLAELPRAAGVSAKSKNEALSKLIIGIRNGQYPGDLIYQARAAGVPDNAIMRAVGVLPAARGTKPPGPKPPASSAPAVLEQPGAEP